MPNRIIENFKIDSNNEDRKHAFKVKYFDLRSRLESYVMSFSKSSANNKLWKQYGDNLKGCALGINFKSIKFDNDIDSDRGKTFEVRG